MVIYSRRIFCLYTPPGKYIVNGGCIIVISLTVEVAISTDGCDEVLHERGAKSLHVESLPYFSNVWVFKIKKI